MLLSFPSGLPARLSCVTLLLALTPLAHAQLAEPSSSVAEIALPDAPVAQQQTPPPTPAAPATNPPVKQGTSSSSAQTSAQKQRTTDEILHDEEKQRLLGVMPMFNVVNRTETIPPLRPGQKFQLFWRSSTDPFIFGLDAFIAGVGQADDSNSGSKTVTRPDGTTERVRYGFPQGVKGYLQRFGATYADTFDGNFWGNAVLPVLLKEDPRYYRMGNGSFVRRFLYSASTTVWCRRDSGSWGPNYANVAGNFIGGAISNLYYPSEVGGIEKTAVSAMTVTAEGTFGAELIEFWPDIERHYRKKRLERLQKP